MSRPLRFEYPNAWCHVMNGGSGYRDNFCNEYHRILFLDLLSVYSQLPANAEIPEIKTFKSVTSIVSIIRAVSVAFATPDNEMLQAKRG